MHISTLGLDGESEIAELDETSRRKNAEWNVYGNENKITDLLYNVGQINDLPSSSVVVAKLSTDCLPSHRLNPHP